MFSLFYIYSARRPSTGIKCLHWKTTEGQPQGNRDSRNQDKTSHSEALGNCHAIFLPYLRHEPKERLHRRVESRGSKTEFLALERGNLFNQEDARRSTEKRRRYRNKLTLLMYSRRFTMLCSNCCFLACGRQKTINISARKEKTKFVAENLTLLPSYLLHYSASIYLLWITNT